MLGIATIEEAGEYYRYVGIPTAVGTACKPLEFIFRLFVSSFDLSLRIRPMEEREWVMYSHDPSVNTACLCRTTSCTGGVYLAS